MFVIFNIVLIITIKAASGDIAVYGISSDCKFNPAIISSCNIIVFNDTDGVSKFNMSGNLKIDLFNTFVNIVVMVRSDRRESFDRIMYRTNIDSCKAQKGMFGNVFAKIVVESFAKHSNFTFQCLQKKGFYVVTSLPFADPSLFPDYFRMRPVGVEIEWEMTSTVRAKVANVKSVAPVYTHKVRGVTVF